MVLSHMGGEREREEGANLVTKTVAIRDSLGVMGSSIHHQNDEFHAVLMVQSSKAKSEAAKSY